MPSAQFNINSRLIRLFVEQLFEIKNIITFLSVINEFDDLVYQNGIIVG